ncbi:hypothetical protein [Peribacillus simplex]|uniref:hypothetical protein n=1 Tax=Peribacillus simplex TaxID=1478 RepID=UPI0036705F18
MTLDKGKKDTEDIVINQEVLSLLDSFADQQKFNNSDLIGMAIFVLIEKYK